MSKQEEDLRAVAEGLTEALEMLYGKKMGFFLCVSPFDENQDVADYIANVAREDGIAWVRETVERLENNEDIPATVGGEQ